MLQSVGGQRRELPKCGRHANQTAAVLALVGEHDGHVVHRVRTDGAAGRPLEIQLFEWASREAMDRYMADQRRTALSADREQAIARTEIVPVQLS
jgi:hypothetical protein